MIKFSKNKRRRLAFIGSIFAISLLSLILIIINFRDNIVFFYAPSELSNKNIIKKVKNSQFRVGGLVKKGSINKINNLETEFVISDNISVLTINYRGILPNLFREGQGVVAKGNLNIEQNKFYSQELLVKHDEKYEPPEIKKISKEGGAW